MTNYEKLRTFETAKTVPVEFKEQFENALNKAFGTYKENGSYVVDSLEDNPMELAYSKGFLAGCIYSEMVSNNMKK